jgi:hypothetical protein
MEVQMGLALFILLLILIFGLPIGGYSGWYGPHYGWGGSGFFVIILILVLIFFPHPW